MDIRLDIVPGFWGGHVFSWTLDPGVVVSGSMTFVVEQGMSHAGPWVSLSPELQDVYAWEAERRVAPKDPALVFRVSGKDASGASLASTSVAPYGQLGRREFLIIAEIMRKELLQMRKMSGVPVRLWTKSIFGPLCTECKDPVTGDIVRPNCKACYGTGRKPGYHGPYEMWATFSPSQRQKGMQEDQTTTREPYTHGARLLGTPPVKKDDIVVDTRADKRYYVDAVENVLELRRVPAVQNVTVNEIPSSDPVYRLSESK